MKDMTVGKPSRVLWLFALPLLVSVVFQQLYNIADSVIAGQFIGESALAAVGASYPITMIYMAICFGSNIGCSVVIAQLFGAKQLQKVKTAVTTSFLAAVVVSLILIVVGIFTAAPLMRLIKTPADIFDDGVLYLSIYVGGILFLFLYNVGTGIFTALGDSKTPLYFLIASSLGNIGLDILFVVPLKMGVAGVAWATFLAQGLSAVATWIVLFVKMKRLYPQKAPLFSPHMFGNICRYAVPSILQQSFVSVGNFMIQGLINRYGSAVIAGYSAALKLNTFAVTCIVTVANSLSTFTAQNKGADQPERIKQGYRAGMLMGLMFAVPFSIAYAIFGDAFVRIFLSDPSAVASDTGKMFLLLVAPFYAVCALKVITDSLLRGAGAVNLFVITTFLDLILRVAFSYLLSPVWQTNGIWASWGIGWAISALLSFGFYLSGIWKKANAHID